jgi:outer membrane protein assembly factor BamB
MLLALAAIAPAADWPQWLGPHRDGTTSETIKPWTEPPKALWRVAVGAGHSSPVVVDGQVCLHSKTPGKDEERLVIYDPATGAEVHAHAQGRAPFASPFGAGPRATPAIAPDGQIVSFGVTGDLNTATRIRPWQYWGTNPLTQFHAAVPKFGVSASPLIESGLIIVLAGGKGASLVAYGRKSGEVVWKSLDDAASYASPIMTEYAGKRQLIALTADGVVSLEPMTGELYWRYPFKDLIAESSTTPLRVGDLIVASSVTLGSVGLKLGAKDGKPSVTEAWKNPALCCYFSTPVAVDTKDGGHDLYMVTGSVLAAMSGKAECALNCVDAATGKVRWTHAKVGKFHAALIRTGDQKLLMLSDTGELTMIDPDQKEYRELARAKVCGETWAHPALANGRLYVRDNKELICLQMDK